MRYKSYVRDARDARYIGSTRAARKRRGEGRGADEAVDGLYCMTRSAASRLRGSYVPMVDACNDC